MTMSHYVWALLSPAGRISRGALLMLAVPLAVATFAARFHLEMELQQGHEVADWWYALILVLIWPQFCLVSRSLQNSGIPGVVVMPLFGLVVFDFLLLLDPSVLGTTDEAFESNRQLLDTAMWAAANLLRGAVVYGIVMGSSETANAYGPPFGTDSAEVVQKKHAKIRERVRAEHSAGQSSDALSRTPALVRAGASTSAALDAAASGKLGFNRPATRKGFGTR